MSKLKHHKKFLVNLIRLTMEKMRKDSGKIATDICESLEKKLIEENFFEGLPFKWIGLSILLGIKEEEIIFDRIDRDYEVIDLSIEVYCGGMRQMTVEEFTLFLEKPIYKAMLWICEKYGKNPEFIHEHFRHVALD